MFCHKAPPAYVMAARPSLTHKAETRNFPTLPRSKFGFFGLTIQTFQNHQPLIRPTSTGLFYLFFKFNYHKFSPTETA